MSYEPQPPAYAPPAAESKGLYPSVPPEQQQPGGYYPAQQPAGPTAPPGQTAVTYYPASGPSQQHPQQLVISPAAPVVEETKERPQSFVGHIVFSCLVFWCCAWPCGLVAFILAAIAACKTTEEWESARQMGKASLVLSIIGLVVGIIMWIIIIVTQAFGQ